ncbi:hypothetical protein SteCoe_15454 [Stentor coeruleus]|uniref:Uncharacterized protein n=1 Tax=Stentor coeruleus TaxID=5963 RepID=A0A1R2C3L0_9CILI|nr:hypothetical protein SteCoe_15454 [Stentor coeruleus]
MDASENMEIEYELVIEEEEALDIHKNPSYRALTSVSMELGMDEVLTKLHEFQENKCPSRRKRNNGVQKKRGRKPIRPLDPIKKKTEEKDKYWLRNFRKYIKENFHKISPNLTSDDNEFWTEHLSTQGVPEKGNKFSSYGKKYKNYLFSNFDFVYRFQQWFLQYAENEISKKYPPGSDLWFVFYDYGSKELFNYVPKGCSSLDSAGSTSSPRSFSANDIAFATSDTDQIDFCMVNGENEVIDSFFNEN